MLYQPSYIGPISYGYAFRFCGAERELESRILPDSSAYGYCGYDIEMPWTADDAERHTHKATTPELKELWARVANDSLKRDGDEGRAIREANAVIARQA